ncbi:hypothetical protein [Serratia liquefaciens]|uniref:hypothetical protein n=1 Tax=Serratia liquefaciens TaxID=614 RepID=UPI002157BB4E|nr:hypothetical protein [Serratia liquefaciens]
MSAAFVIFCKKHDEPLIKAKFMNVLKANTNVDLQWSVTSPSTIKSMDTLIKENQPPAVRMNMKEFGFTLLYNDWMQQTLLSDGLIAEDQVEW